MVKNNVTAEENDDLIHVMPTNLFVWTEVQVNSPHDEHRSSGPRPVKFTHFYLRPKTSKISPFLFKLYKNKFKNLIQTSKFKFTFRGLQVQIKMFFLSMQVRYPTDYGYQLNNTILFFL